MLIGKFGIFILKIELIFPSLERPIEGAGACERTQNDLLFTVEETTPLILLGGNASHSVVT